jgi:iron complex transport system substrate-binding protein
MAAHPRVVSLLPSATEIAVALGLGEQLLGRSHECDYPPWVKALPVLTSTKLEKGLTSGEIDRRVQEIVRQGLSVYAVDSERLRALKPDVILTQSQCAVCAVTPADLEEALAAWVGSAPQLLSLAPDDLGDVWGDIGRVGEAIGAADRAAGVVAALRRRLAGLEERARRRGTRPRIAAIEWIDPLMAAGNWVPELIEIAGGEPLFAAAGQHSPWLEWKALLAADPDMIVMMPCGYRVPQTMIDMAPLAYRQDWRSLRAVREGQVFVTDGQYFFNRPGPRLVESAEIIADCIDGRPDESGEERWVRLPPP